MFYRSAEKITCGDAIYNASQLVSLELLSLVAWFFIMLFATFVSSLVWRRGLKDDFGEVIAIGFIFTVIFFIGSSINFVSLIEVTYAPEVFIAEYCLNITNK